MKEQQEEKMICPVVNKCKNKKWMLLNCPHSKPHIKEPPVLWFKNCPPCIPVKPKPKKLCPRCGQMVIGGGMASHNCVEPEPKPEGELTCKHEKDYCKYPGCLENDCTGFELKQPEQEKCGRCKGKKSIPVVIDGGDYPEHGIMEIRKCPDCKGTGKGKFVSNGGTLRGDTLTEITCTDRKGTGFKSKRT